MTTIVGVDEAGRGPLAGPVAVGAVAVEDGFDLLTAFPGLNDSKKLSEKKREMLFSILEEQSCAGNVRFRVEFSSAEMIDEKGIMPAVCAALERGVRNLLPDPEKGKVFLDGALRASSEYEQETIIGGDGLVPTIMLASIAAKVTRDRLMQGIAKRFPAYGFDQHKGYGTKAHYAALIEYGLCEEHRRTFIHLGS
ncbi:ribonuclease HII [Patescibacteria group bacterium]|nr:ribonuclease HII [Patescibacteria group bacterium]